jgi:hypothetical protein
VDPLKRRGGSLLPTLVLVLCLPATVLAQTGTIPPSRPLVEGEDLIYNVRYTFIDLGQVRVRTGGKHPGVSYNAFDTRANIDSYKGIPFVDLHAVFESVIDSAVYSRGFMGKVKQDNLWDFARYHFEYDLDRVIMEMGDRDTVVAERETLSVNAHQQDGLSLFFFAREHLYDKGTVRIPCIITEKPVSAYINFTQERDAAEVDAIEYPVDVVKFDGKLDFIGVFGLSGEFEGWFSNDEARIPILAKMKVLIGSVTIELMSWKRKGWAPPRAQG